MSLFVVRLNVLKKKVATTTKTKLEPAKDETVGYCERIFFVDGFSSFV